MIKSCATIFGERLRQLRFESGLSQQTLSTKLEISKAALCYYENGQRAPDINILACMAEYFNVSADYLLGKTEIKSNDLDAQKFFKRTGLSENVFDYLCFRKSHLEIAILNAFFEDNHRELYNLSKYTLVKYENHAFRKAVYKKFVKDNNLPISDEMIKERGEHSLKGVYKGNEYFDLYSKLNDYYQDWSEKLGMEKDLKEYNEFRLQKTSLNLVENTFCFFEHSAIADYYDEYYTQLLDLIDQGDDAKLNELEIARINFLGSICGMSDMMKGAPDNGSNNPKKE